MCISLEINLCTYYILQIFLSFFSTECIIKKRRLSFDFLNIQLNMEPDFLDVAAGEMLMVE